MIDKPILVQSDEIEIDAGTTTISNAELAEAVKDHPDEAVSFLSEKVSPVNLDEISLDGSGRVVINDAAFSKALADQPAPAEAEQIQVKNGVCGAGC